MANTHESVEEFLARGGKIDVVKAAIPRRLRECSRYKRLRCKCWCGDKRSTLVFKKIKPRPRRHGRNVLVFYCTCNKEKEV